MSNDFQGMPEISENTLAYMKTRFTPYLFFETKERGVRQYTCSACGAEFLNGVKVPQRTLTEADTALWGASHNSVHTCPHCGAEAKLKNIKKCKIGRLSEYNHMAVFLQAEDGSVWVRCFNYFKEYLSPKSPMKTWEVMRYRLAPSEADFWEFGDGYYRSDEWFYTKIIRDAFVWNHAFYTEKYSYTVYEDHMKISDTFLKYHSFWSYEGCHGYNLPFMKYLCWYARHPKIEMLVKLGHFKTVDQMIFDNSDIKTVLDWSADTPWALHRLPKTVYKVWKEQYYADMDVLKVYHAMKGTSEKDLKTARMVLQYNWNKLKPSKQLVSRARQMKVTAADVIKYCKRVSERTKGRKHMSDREAFETWCDYLDMARIAGVLKTTSVFPSNLKAAHDSLIAAANLAQSKTNMKNLKKQAEEQASQIAKRFPKVNGIYQKIKNKYAYSDGKYAIVVPDGIADIVLDGMVLSHCTTRTDRYYERISTKETFILFLRHADEPDVPWYALEVEPGGTIRQKRTKGDVQLDDLNDALPFLRKWQEEIAARLTASDLTLAKKSKVLRNIGFEDLRKTKKKINYGELSGKLLIEVLEQDLMEAEYSA